MYSLTISPIGENGCVGPPLIEDDELDLDTVAQVVRHQLRSEADGTAFDITVLKGGDVDGEDERFACPNCLRRHGPTDECLIGVVVQVYRDRHDELPPREVLEQLDPDRFWGSYGGPAVDELERLVAEHRAR